METNAFLTLFEKALIQNGFTKEAAHYHTLKVSKSLSHDDKAKIYNIRVPEEVEKFAYSYTRRVMTASSMTSTEPYDSKADTMTISHTFSTAIDESADSDNNSPLSDIPSAQNEEESAAETPNDRNYDDDTYDSANEDNSNDTDSPAINEEYFENDEVQEEYVKTAVPSTATKNTVSEQLRTDIAEKKYKAPESAEYNPEKTQKIDKIKSISKEPLSANGKKEFAKRIAIASVPAGIATLLIAVLVILGYTFIAALIAFFIAILVAVTVLGGVSTLAGLIYGIVTLFSSAPEGIYEIGITFIILAVTLALAILSYNIAVRFIPVLWSKYTASVTNELISKLRRHLNNVRKECNKQ